MEKIPKIIHYCWVGGNPKPESVLYCIESWKKYCPEYEIKEWNESNYDFTQNLYMNQAYEAKKWGFVPDYARLDIIYKYGGIYLDTDVEVIRSLDELLKNNSFFGFEDTGENEYFVACGLGFGAKPGNELIKKLRDYYETVSFLNVDNSLNLTPAPRHNLKVFEEYGVQMNNQYQDMEGNIFFPSEYFCPKIFKTGVTHKTKNTFSIHHFTASWMDEKIRKEIAHSQKVCHVLGDRVGHYYLFAESVWEKYGAIGIIKKPFIELYERQILYKPLITAMLKKNKKDQKESSKVVLFDTAKYSKNIGDEIIMKNCEKQLHDWLEGKEVVRISTHEIPENPSNLTGKYKLVCGTNILSGRMDSYGLWKLPKNLEGYTNILLMGVGFDSYNSKSNLYTRLLFKYMLSAKGIHSVRDSFSEKCLKSMGIQNVLNTGCPTMWGLTPEFCETIPVKKAKNVICTITDYSKDKKNDFCMLETLGECYENVYVWLQGSKDREYLKELGMEEKVIIVEESLEQYDKLLEQSDLDYVGTRLHAGIRALNAGHRSIIIAIDNRAECIAKDTNLPIVFRNDVEQELEHVIYSKLETKIKMPFDAIEKWKRQFK